MEYFIELFFSGMTRGSIYALIALGYTMVYGIIGLINFAHGEIYMIVVGSSDMIILLVTAVVMVILIFLIKYTQIGKAMRATAQDRTMAMLVGINVNKILSTTFVIGSALAAIGGLLVASHIGQINFYIGFIAGIKAFTAAVLGGIGSIPGAVLGGMVLGLTESFTTGYVSSDYEDVFAFSLLVLILIFKPSGLLGRAESKKV